MRLFVMKTETPQQSIGKLCLCSRTIRSRQTHGGLNLWCQCLHKAWFLSAAGGYLSLMQMYVISCGLNFAKSASLTRVAQEPAWQKIANA